eukprot:1770672-Prymnesium_polylepis.1
MSMAKPTQPPRLACWTIGRTVRQVRQVRQVRVVYSKDNCNHANASHAALPGETRIWGRVRLHQVLQDRNIPVLVPRRTEGRHRRHCGR